MDTGQRNPMHFGPGVGPPTTPGSVGDGTGGGVYQYDGLVNMQQVHLKSSNLQAVLSGTAGNYGNGFQQGARQTTITNMPESIQMSTYVGNGAQGGTLPPMGSFIAGVDQHSLNPGQCVAAGYKPGMESWVNQGQGLQQALPSFGHFLSMHPNQAASQQEQPLNQAHGQVQGQQMVSGANPQLYHCSPNRFQNNFLQPQCIGPPGMAQHVAQNFLGGGMIGNFGFQSHSIGNVNMGMKMNVNMGMMGDLNNLNSGNVIGGRLSNHPHHASPLQGGVNMVYNNQPPNMSMNVSPVSPYYFVPSRSSASLTTGCNQITNTTTTITTTTSSSFGTVSTAHVHSKKSIASATTSKFQAAMSMQGQGALSPVPTDSETSVQKKIEGCTGCTSTPVSKIEGATKVNTTISNVAKSAMFSESNMENRLSDDNNVQSRQNLQFVIVPFGWKRVVEEGSIVYYSPSNIRLSTKQAICQYLSSEGTCKCGLECPLVVENVFNFDVTLQTKQWTIDVSCSQDLTNFCNHKRKTIAMATFHGTKSVSPDAEGVVLTPTPVVMDTSGKQKKDPRTKKKKCKSGSSPYDGLLVSELLARRDKLKHNVAITTPHTTSSILATANQQAALQHVTNMAAATAQCMTAKGRSNIFHDPADELGPITCHVPRKLDFSHERSGMDCLQNMVANYQNVDNFGMPCFQQSPIAVQTVFPPDHLKNQPVFVQSSPVQNPMGSPQNFGCVPNPGVVGNSFAVNISQGANPVALQHSPGFMVPNSPMSPANAGGGSLLQVSPQQPHRFAAPGFDHPSVLQGGVYHLSSQHGSLVMNNVYPHVNEVMWVEQKEVKVKKSKAEKKKEKIKNIYESGTPPPNVDVRQLKDGGRGPIPKQKIEKMATFLENPTAFMAQQAALVNDSLSSGQTSPLHNILPDIPEVSSSITAKTSSDTQSTASSATTVSTTTTSSSPSKPKHLPLATTKPPVESERSSSTATSPKASSPTETDITSAIVSKLESQPTTSEPSGGSQSESNTPTSSTSNDSIQPDSVSAAELKMPSSVVHHPPTPQPEDSSHTPGPQPSASNATTPTVTSASAKTQAKNKYPPTTNSTKISVSSTASPVPTHSTQNSNAQAQVSIPTQGGLISTTLQGQFQSQGQSLGSGVGMNAIQQVLGHHGTNEFPASSLLSAAARAQLSQQNQLNLLMAQQMCGNQPLQYNFNPSVQNNNAAISAEVLAKAGCGNMVDCLSLGTTPAGNNHLLLQQATEAVPTTVPSVIPSGVNFTSMQGVPLTMMLPQIQTNVSQNLPFQGNVLQNPLATIQTVAPTGADEKGVHTVAKPVSSQAMNDMQKPGEKSGSEGAIGDSKIPEDVQTPVAAPDQEAIIGQCLNPQVLAQNNFNYPVVSVNTPMPPISVPMVTAVTNSLTQVIPAAGVSQSVFNQQSILQLINTMNVPTLQNSPLLFAANPQDGIQNAFLGNPMTAANHYLSNINDCSAPRLVNPTETLSDNSSKTFLDGATSIPVSRGGDTPKEMGGALQKPQFTSTNPHNPHIDISSKAMNTDKLPLSPTSEALLQATNTSATQVLLLPNVQMPLLQVLGTNQLTINTTIDKSGIPQFPVASQPPDLQAMLAQIQNMTSMGIPINMAGMQQMWNGVSAGNNLTAMQIQALQLQQQLLQQIQQLQGMQTVINQMNLQGLAGINLGMQDKSGMVLDSAGMAHPCNAMMEKEEAPTSPSLTSYVMDKNISQSGIVETTVSQTSEEGSPKDSTRDTPSASGSHNSCQGDTKTCDKERMEGSYLEDSIPRSIECDSSSTASTMARGQIQFSRGQEKLVVNENSETHDTGEHFSKTTLASENSSSTDYSSSTSSERKECKKLKNSNPSSVNNSDRFGNISRLALVRKDRHEKQKSVQLSRRDGTVLPGANESIGMAGNLGKIPQSYPSSTEVAFHSTLSQSKDLNCQASKHSDVRLKIGTASPLFKNIYRRKADRRQEYLHQSRTFPAPKLLKIRIGSEHPISEPIVIHGSGRRIDSLVDDNMAESDLSVDSDSSDDESCTSSEQLDYDTYSVNNIDDSGEMSGEDQQKENDVRYTYQRGIKRLREDEKEGLYLEDDTYDSDELAIPPYPRTFNVGDLVWGQIRGFPSWPGKLVNENEVKGSQKAEDGKLWVRWFGDHTFTQVEPDKLKTLSEGLEAHHRARKKYRKGRKMNTNLESAIQEAMTELDRQTAQTMENRLNAKGGLKSGKILKKRKAR
ncbi:hypothetical protein ScPMuIL_012481 [Solemya velum]